MIATRRSSEGIRQPATSGARRWLRWTATTAVLLVSSCGGGDLPTESGVGTTAPPGGDLGALLPTASPDFVGASAARTEASGTGRLSLELRVEGTDVIDGVLLTADGSFALEDHATQLDVEPGPVGLEGGLVASRTIAQGSDVYVRDESVTEALGIETPWVRYFDECGDDGVGQGLVPFVGADAIGLLDAVAATGAEVTEVGDEKIAGFPAVHFRSEVDLGAAVAAASPDCRDEWAAFEGSSVPVDIWIHTESGVVMREALAFDLIDFLERTDPESAEDLADISGTLQYQVDFFDLGEQIPIDIPTDSDVTEITRDDYERATDDPETSGGGGADPLATTPAGNQTGSTTPRRPRTDW